MNPPDIPPALWSALHHDDLMKRNSAWYELLDYARTQYPNKEDPVHALENILLDLLDSEYGDIRAHAAEELGRMRISEATTRLIDLLDDPYYSVRHATILALGNINNPAAVPALANQIHHGRDVPLIISSLSEFDHPSADAAIATALGDPAPYIRVEVVHGVVDGHYLKAVPILIQMTRDPAELQPSSDGGPTPTVADAAARALKELRQVATTSGIKSHKSTAESLDLLQSYFENTGKH